MARLVALRGEPGLPFVTGLLDAWDRGDAVYPVDPRVPHPPSFDPPLLDGDALVVATSGTTGTPKGVVLTHAAVLASARASSRRLAVDPSSDRWLCCLPLAHVGGLSVVTRAVLTGTPLTFDGAERATLASMVRTQVARTDVSSFRAVLLGGDRPPEGVPANVVVTYGMTETGSGIAYDGVALDGVEVRVDADGQVWVRGPMLLRCYDDGTDPKDAEGWFATGDAGSLDADGRLHVEGRIADVIVTGGEKVWPTPVEEALRSHPAVADAAVAGRPDEEWGARVVAYVVPADPATPPTLDGLRGWVKERLPPWSAPKELVVVDEVPRTPAGKVRRTAL